MLKKDNEVSCKNCNEDSVKVTKRSKEEKEKLIKRLNIIEGQVRGVKQMILDDRYCDDVLTQMLAINKALDSLENIILERHLHTCIKNKIENGSTEEVSKEIMDLFKKLR